MSHFDRGLLWLWSTIVVGDFDSNLAGILPSACQVLPNVFLSAARNNNVLEVDPRLADEISLFIICENRDLELVVVGRVVDRKAQLLVPVYVVSKSGRTRTQLSGSAGLPFRCLAASDIC